MSKKTNPKFTRKGEKNENERFIVSSLIGFAVGLALSFALLFIGSALLLLAKDPDSLTTLFSYLTISVSLFFSGVVSSRVSCGNMLASIFTGVMYTLFSFSLHLIFTKGGADSGVHTLLFLAFPLISLLGGYVARPKNKKKFKVR
ncbi:MAG: hypothetical protein E7635_02690 [Ruminococcaceae bacterium]|nr:hypothetical protein [Oscillospiraceae bacterium]